MVMVRAVMMLVVAMTTIMMMLMVLMMMVMMVLAVVSRVKSWTTDLGPPLPNLARWTKDLRLQALT